MPVCGDPACENCGLRCDKCDELLGYEEPVYRNIDVICKYCAEDYWWEDLGDSDVPDL